MNFTKMHGLGNDYVYINGFEESVTDRSDLAIKLSDRHFGVGSDGVIFINPSENADFEMEMYNADGSRSEMCGNGIRCVAKYVYDHGMTDKKTVTVDTLAGVKTLQLTVDDETGKVSLVRVDMGVPCLDPKEVPCIPELFEGYAGGPVINLPLKVSDRSFKTTCVSMGNPHAITCIDEPLTEFPLEVYGRIMETHEAFPKRVNAEFIRIKDRGTVEMRVWERGTGETMACGTGATAVAVSSILNGFCDNRVKVFLPGGELLIEWDGKKDSHAFMTGPAVTVFEAELL